MLGVTGQGAKEGTTRNPALATNQRVTECTGKPLVELTKSASSLFHLRHHHHYVVSTSTTSYATPHSVSQNRITPTRMRPPTRSTRSVRPSLNTNNPRRRRSTPGPIPSSHGPHPVASQSSSGPAGSKNLGPPKPPKPQSIIIPTFAAANAADFKVNPGTAPVVGCFPVEPPSSTFVYENQNQCQSPLESFLSLVSPNLSVAGSPIILGKQPPRPRHRMSTDKLETLDAFFRHNTHPSRKEKEAICKDLDM